MAPRKIRINKLAADTTLTDNTSLWGQDSDAATAPSRYPIAQLDARVNAAIATALEGVEDETGVLTTASIGVTVQAQNANLNALAGTGTANSIVARNAGTDGAPDYVTAAELTSVTPVSADEVIGFTQAGLLRKFPVSGLGGGVPGGAGGGILDYAYEASISSGDLARYVASFVGEVVTVETDKKLSGGATRSRGALAQWECVAVDNSANVGLLGTKRYVDTGGVTGWVLEGVSRWRARIDGMTDMNALGIDTNAGATESNIDALNDVIKATSKGNGRLTGSGDITLPNSKKIAVDDAFVSCHPLSITATAARDVATHGAMVELNGGGKATDAYTSAMQATGTPNGSWGTVDLASAITLVSVSNASPSVITWPSSAPANGTPFRFTGGTLGAPLVANVYYYVSGASGSTSNFARGDGATVATTGATSGTITVRTGRAIGWDNINLNSQCFKIVDDNTGGDYHLMAYYCGDAFEVNGDTEKGRLVGHTVGANRALRVTLNGSTSPDSWRYDLTCTRVNIVFEGGPDTTGWAELLCESRIDLGNTITLADGAVVGEPALKIDNGKHDVIANSWFRSGSGDPYLLCHRTGGNAANGTDSLTLLNVVWGDNVYARIGLIDGCQHFNGFGVVTRHCHDPRLNANETGGTQGVGSIPREQWRINRVFTGHFGASLMNVGNVRALHIGDNARGRTPFGLVLGRQDISMRTRSNLPFNPLTGVFPTDATAIHVEDTGGNGLYIPTGNIDGNISLDQWATDVSIELPAVWFRRGYSLTAHASATATIIVKGACRSVDVMTKPWLRAGINVIVESFKDYGGVGGRYFNGVWTLPGYAWAASAAEIGSISHPINQRFKQKGLIDLAGTKLKVATGTAAADGWGDSTDTTANVITPAYESETTAYVALFSVAPSTPHKNILDRVFFRLKAASMLTKMEGFYLYGQALEQQSLLNMAQNNYHWTKNGNPVFDAWDGWSGIGTTTDFLSTAYSGGGVTLNSAHAAIYSLTPSNAGRMLASTNGNVGMRAGSSGRVGINSTSHQSYTGKSTGREFVAGVRTASNSQKNWVDGVLISTTAQLSGALPDDLLLLKDASAGSNGKVAFASYGDELTDAEMIELFSIADEAILSFQALN